jgi:hypothetical protein
MAEMTIRLRFDPATGKKDIIVSLRSDDDALPYEHEQQHAALVDKLIQGGLLKAAEAGKVVIEREEEAGAPAASPSRAEESGRQAQAQAEGAGS